MNFINEKENWKLLGKETLELKRVFLRFGNQCWPVRWRQSLLKSLLKIPRGWLIRFNMIGDKSIKSLSVKKIPSKGEKKVVGEKYEIEIKRTRYLFWKNKK